jgi:hypothetical protein
MQYPDIIGPLKDCRNCTHFAKEFKWELKNGKYGYWFYCDLKLKYLIAQRGLNFCDQFESRLIYRSKAKYFGYDHPDCMRCTYAKSWYKDCRLIPDKYFCNHLSRKFNKPPRGFIASCGYFYMSSAYHKITTHATIFKAQAEKLKKDLDNNKRIPSKLGQNIIEIEKNHLISINLNGFLNLNLSRQFQNIFFNSLNDKDLIQNFGKINRQMQKSAIENFEKILITSGTDFSNVILNPIIQDVIHTNIEKNATEVDLESKHRKRKINEPLISYTPDKIPRFINVFSTNRYQKRILHLLPDQLLFKRETVPIEISKETVKEIEHFTRLYYGKLYNIANVTNMFVDFMEGDSHNPFKIQSLNYIHSISSKLAINYRINQLKSKKIFERNYKFMFSDYHPLSWLNSYQQTYIYLRYKSQKVIDRLTIAELSKLFKIDSRTIKQLIIAYSKVDPDNKVSYSEIENITNNLIINNFFKTDWFTKEFKEIISIFENDKNSKKKISKFLIFNSKQNSILNISQPVKKELKNYLNQQKSKIDAETIVKNILRSFLVDFEKKPPETFTEYNKILIKYSQLFSDDFLAECINRIGFHKYPGFNLMRRIQEELNPYLPLLKIVHYFIEKVFSNKPQYSYRRFWEIINKNQKKIEDIIKKEEIIPQSEKKIKKSVKNEIFIVIERKTHSSKKDYFENNFDILLNSYEENYELNKNTKYFIDFLSSIKVNHQFLNRYFINDKYPELQYPKGLSADKVNINSILQLYQFFLELQSVIWSFLNSNLKNPKNLIGSIISTIQNSQIDTNIRKSLTDNNENPKFSKIKKKTTEKSFINKSKNSKESENKSKKTDKTPKLDDLITQKIHSKLVYFLRQHNIFISFNFSDYYIGPVKFSSIFKKSKIRKVKSGKKVHGGGKFTIRPILPEEFRFRPEFLDEKGNVKRLDEMDLPTQHQYLDHMISLRFLNRLLTQIITNIGLFGDYYAKSVFKEAFNTKLTNEKEKLNGKKGRDDNSFKFSRTGILHNFESSNRATLNSSITKFKQIQYLKDQVFQDPITSYKFLFTGFIDNLLIWKLKNSDNQDIKDKFKNSTKYQIKNNYSSNLRNNLERINYPTNPIGKYLSFSNLKKAQGNLYNEIKAELKKVESSKKKQDERIYSYLNLVNDSHKNNLLKHLLGNNISTKVFSKNYQLIAEDFRKDNSVLISKLQNSEHLKSLNNFPVITEKKFKDLCQIWKALSLVETQNLNEKTNKKIKYNKQLVELNEDINKNKKEIKDLKKKIAINNKYYNYSFQIIRFYLDLIMVFEHDDANKKILYNLPVYPNIKYIRKIFYAIKRIINEINSKNKNKEKRSFSVMPIINSFSIFAVSNILSNGNKNEPNSSWSSLNYDVLNNYFEIFKKEFLDKFYSETTNLSDKSNESDIKTHEKSELIEEEDIETKIDPEIFHLISKPKEIFGILEDEMEIENESVPQKEKQKSRFPIIKFNFSTFTDSLDEFCKAIPYNKNPKNEEKTEKNNYKPQPFKLVEPVKLFLGNSMQTLTEQICYFGRTKIQLQIDFDKLSLKELDDRLNNAGILDKSKRPKFRDEADIFRLPEIIERTDYSITLDGNLARVEEETIKIKNKIEKLEGKLGKNSLKNREKSIYIKESIKFIKRTIKSLQYKRNQMEKKKIYYQKRKKLIQNERKKRGLKDKYISYYPSWNSTTKKLVKNPSVPEQINMIKIYDDLDLSNRFNNNKKDFHRDNYYKHFPKVISSIDYAKNAHQPHYEDNKIRQIVYRKKPLYVEIQLSKNIINKVRAGADLKSIMIIPPQFPNYKTQSNVLISGPEEIMHPKPKMEIRSSKSCLAMGLDMNRLSSMRAITFGMIEEEDKIFKTQNNFEELQNNLPRIIGIGNSNKFLENIRKQLSQRIQIRKEKLEKIRDGFHNKKRDKEIKEDFEDVKNRNNKILTQLIKTNYNDIINSPVMYWEKKLRHMESHIAQVHKSISTIKNKANKKLKLKKNRLFRELSLLHHRRETIRDEIECYVTKSLFYMIKKYKPKVFSYENLRTMTTKGTKKHLANLISEMIKRLGSVHEEGSIIYRVNKWCEFENIDIKFEEINARNTSKIHFTCRNSPQTTNISRKSDWDYGFCKKCAIFYIDTHLNASYNIASLGFLKLSGKDPPPIFNQF